MRRALLSLLLAFGAGAGLAAGAYALGSVWRNTSTDAFCSRCHEMAAYFAAHGAGPHRGIPCAECHIGPGALASVQAKLRGLHFLVVHKQGGAERAPEGVVSDRACLQEGCHPSGGGDGVPWRGTWFHHSNHAASGRTDLAARLRCTHCHGLSLAAGHGTQVRPEACVLCHLAGKRLPEERPVDEACVLCHAMPATVEFGAGARLDHARARAEGHACLACHAGLDAAGMPVERTACAACHEAQAAEHIGRPGFSAYVHRRHGLLSSVRCAECHGEPAHHQPSPWQAGFPAEGLRCPHASGITKNGSPRPFVRMSCAFCHREGTAGGGGLARERCGLCHPPR